MDLELQMVAANPPGSIWGPIKVDERPKAKVDLDARPARLRVGTIHSAITEPELRANVRDYLFAKRKLADLEMIARASCAEMARRGMQHRDITADTTIHWPAPYVPKLVYKGGDLGGWSEEEVKARYGWSRVPGAAEPNDLFDDDDDDDNDDDDHDDDDHDDDGSMAPSSRRSVDSSVGGGLERPGPPIRSIGGAGGRKRRRVEAGPLSLTSTHGETALADRGVGGSGIRRVKKEEGP